MPAKPNIFSVLFMTVDGEPMSFYLRPGPVKRKLQPLITAGGGLLCNVQQPGAILLIDPEEGGSIPETTAHWYVSTQYIHDCIEKDEQLNLEDYRLNPEVVQRQSARLNNKKDSPGLLGGRVAYTPEEDAAILSYITKHKTEIGGNRLWQQMEKQHVTSHSWQSMKYRYRVRLAQKHSEVEEVETTEEELKATEEETKEEENQETEDAAPPQTHSEETDLTQIDAEPVPAESTQPENVEAQTSSSPQQEVQRLNPQTDEQPAESTQIETIEAETSNSPRPEEPRVDPQTDVIPAESTEPKTDASQTTVSPQKESVPEDSQPAQPEPLPSTSSKKPKEKQKASPKRRSARRQLELEETLSSQPYSKKLRSASASGEEPSPSPSPQPSKKTKSALKSSSQKDTTVEQPPPKRARRKSGATVAESQQVETVTVTETVQADEESESVLQTGEKKKEKSTLGILELATKEFEDESEPEDEAPSLQNPAETAATSTDPLLPSSDTAVDAASTQSIPEPGLSLQENVQEAPAASSSGLPETAAAEPVAVEPVAVEPVAVEPVATKPAAAEHVAPEPAAAEYAAAKHAAAEPAAPEPAAPEPAAAKPAAAEAVQATSKAHLFIFDSESQEEDSQSIVGGSTAAEPQPTVNKDAALSLTQVQLEEDKQRVRELISQTNQDLFCVTKALLRTSGDFSAALDLLLNPSSISEPFWNRCDDSLLLSADPAVRQQLQEKYGEEGVAKRIVFLEVEG